MSFLNFWAIGIGAAALAAPLVIHWLTKPRPVRMPLSTLRFVREAVRQRRARHLLRDAIILSLRVLAVAMLALAVARPLLAPQSRTRRSAIGDTVRVVIVDVSQSMAATIGASQQIARAKAVAGNQYLQYEPGLWANLILAGATPRTIFEGPSTNFETLRDELSRCQALPERLDVKAALERAGQMLAPTSETDKRRRELVIVSDFQVSSWSKADFSALPPDTSIELESTAPKTSLPNLAILRATARADRARSGSVHLEVEVANFTPADRKMTVEVSLGDARRRLEGVCAAGRKLMLADDMEISGNGWQWGKAELVGVAGGDDALAADNVRPLAVEIRPRPNYALLTRQPARQRPSSSYYLECALAPDGQLGAKASASVVRLDPSTIDAKTLAPFDMVCLDHPGKLSDDAIKVLAASLRRGRPLFYAAGETIDATNLKRLADSAGTGLHMPVEFTPPPVGAARKDLFLTAVKKDQPPFGAFGDSLSSFIDTARFAGGLTSRPIEGGLPGDVLASYNDGSACLVCTVSEVGALVVLNADLAASALPGRSTFVLLVQALADRIMNRTAESRPALCGERLVAQLPPEVATARDLRVVGPKPSADAALGELVDEGASVAWNWQQPDQPGVYRVCRGSETILAQPLEIAAEESQLEYLSPQVIRDRLAVGRDVYYRSAGAEEERRDDLWKWFAVACVICGLGELASLIFFRT